MRLTEHFTIEELTASDYAARHGIDNTPDEDAIQNLLQLAQTLELIRETLGQPVTVNSGFRCFRLNQAIGGDPNSSHMRGLAADIVCRPFGPALSVCKAIATIRGLRFDQIIHEFGSWCHIGIGPRMRGELLTIDRAGTRRGLLP